MSACSSCAAKAASAITRRNRSAKKTQASVPEFFCALSKILPMTSDYPRDLAGYGAKPPHARWPRGARIALQFVLNYEEGGENSILHGDKASEAFLSEIVGAQPVEGARHMSMESLYEYGSRVAVWRLLERFERDPLPLNVYGRAGAVGRS